MIDLPAGKTFASETEARTWRQDTMVALRHATSRAPSAVTVGQRLDELLDGMRDGTVLDRSGRRYRPATIRKYASD